VSNQAFSTELANRSSRVDVRIVARTALLGLLKPVVEFGLDSGLSVQALNSFLREVAVRIVAAEHLKTSRRINFSGIAASTGVPRGEISRILKGAPNSKQRDAERKPPSTGQIVANWRRDPRFTTSTGGPAELRIYGGGATFEALVKNHGRGIPTRAMLDELKRKNLIEMRSSRIVRLKEPAVADRRLTPGIIRAFGSQGSELLSIMLQSMRQPTETLILTNVAAAKIPASAAPLFRREMKSKAADLIAEIQKILAKMSKNPRVRASSRSQVSVTIVFREATADREYKARAVATRRNLRRSL
jgi:hypothetical protein